MLTPLQEWYELNMFLSIWEIMTSFESKQTKWKMSTSQKDQAIKLENGARSDFDPLDESTIEGHQESVDAVVRKYS